ncbi:hypothetical protein BHE74_00038484 [Ensete ventricosum]|nr:hypothetical protein GW17_00025611 [Ensete ventricosum]RWW54913.1 hypothetical protein BHE74_00038484 [Ensete ventricosum]
MPVILQLRHSLSVSLLLPRRTLDKIAFWVKVVSVVYIKEGWRMDRLLLLNNLTEMVFRGTGSFWLKSSCLASCISLILSI